MATNNSINTGPLALDVEMIAGVDQRKLAAPSSLKALTDARVLTGVVQNLGLTISGGTLTLTAADGSALSGGNPGKVFIGSNVNFGQMIQYTLTAPQTITEAALAGGNLFNTVTGRAWADQMPFFVYLVASNTDTNPVMMICRQSHHYIASATIGVSGSPVADSQFSFFSASAPANYVGQSCVCIGSIRMTKDSANAWTFTALNETDGIGRFKEGELFDMASNQGVSAAAGFFLNITPPVFTTNVAKYSIDRQGMCYYYWNFQGDGGTDGSGASACELVVPFDIDGSQGASIFRRGGGAASAFFAGATRTNLFYVWPFTTQSIQFKRTDTNANLTNAAFTNGDRSLTGSAIFFMDSA
jgi:hypothetical protein